MSCLHFSFQSTYTGVPLTVDNVVTTLRKVNIVKDSWQEKWLWCGQEILFLSRSKLIKLTTTCSTNETECYRTMISYWLANHPYASWRELINQLESKDQRVLADHVRVHAEPLTGMPFIKRCHSILITVLYCIPVF